jgi:hypothetical protein
VNAPSREALQGRWVHVHEEDSEDELVFRPPRRPLPPARGRRSFELRPDGTYVESSPGPVDVPETANGRWLLDDDRLVLRPDGDRPVESWRVVAAEADRLRLRRPDSGPSG